MFLKAHVDVIPVPEAGVTSLASPATSSLETSST